MSRLKILAAAAALLAATVTRLAVAQESETPPALTCDSFFAPQNGPATGRSMLVRKIYRPFEGQNRGRNGEFHPAPGGAYLAFWNAPGSRSRVDGYFTTLKSRHIKFVTGGWFSRTLETVTFGKMLDEDYLEGLRFEANTAIECDIDPSFPGPPAHSERRPPSEREYGPPPKRDLSELFKTPPAATAPPPVGTERPPVRIEPPPPKRDLSELFKTPSPPATPVPPAAGVPPAPPGTAGTPPPVASATPPGPPVKALPPKTETPATAEPPPSEWPAKVEKAPDAAPAGVCRADTFEPLPFSDTPRANQTYALRNERKRVKAHDYEATAGEVLGLPEELDIAASSNRLIAYEPVAFLRSTNTNWVSIPGAKVIVRADEKAKPRARATVRIVVVSGAQELLMSGLDLVGADLAKAPAIDVRPDITWYGIEATGALKPPVTFTSFDGLLEAASARATAERLDVLDEAALTSLFDQLQTTLSGFAPPVDRVFWFKGAYAIPAAFPKRFEQFLAQVGESPGIAKLMGDRTGKWFTVVTARMPGFSIAYLKEPMTRLQAGDVIEEDAVAIGARRRLISDVALFSTRLRTGLKIESTPEPASASNPTKLVQNADEVFKERGYLVASSALQPLRAHLVAVQSIWVDGGALSSAAASDLARKLGLLEPFSLQDLLQGGRPAVYPAPPRWTSEALRKPLGALTPKDRDEARDLVKRTADAVARVADAAGTGKTRCAHLFISEQALGYRR